MEKWERDYEAKRYDPTRDFKVSRIHIEQDAPNTYEEKTNDASGDRNTSGNWFGDDLSPYSITRKDKGNKQRQQHQHGSHLIASFTTTKAQKHRACCEVKQ